MDTALQLSLEIERGFERFGYTLSFSRDLIVRKPAEAIEQGLFHLNAIGAISKEECKEHLLNFAWGNLRLEDAMQDTTKKEILEALVRNLKFWYNRYLERISDDENNG